MNIDHRTLLSTSSALLRVHNRKVAAPAFSRFLSTHITNLACEDYEPGFLGSVETYFDRVSLPFPTLFRWTYKKEAWGRGYRRGGPSSRGGRFMRICLSHDNQKDTLPLSLNNARKKGDEQSKERVCGYRIGHGMAEETCIR